MKSEKVLFIGRGEGVKWIMRKNKEEWNVVKPGDKKDTVCSPRVRLVSLTPTGNYPATLLCIVVVLTDGDSLDRVIATYIHFKKIKKKKNNNSWTCGMYIVPNMEIMRRVFKKAKIKFYYNSIEQSFFSPRVTIHLFNDSLNGNCWW